MNSLIFSLQFILLFNTQNDTLCKEKFYKAALKDTSLTSMTFLKLRIVDSSGVEKSVLLPNHTLYYALQKRGLDYNSYRTLMIRVLNFDRKLEYSEYGKLSGALELRGNDYVARIAKKGRKKLIKHFFKNEIFMYDNHAEHFESVVGHLFDMGIIISLVDNGAFAITYKSECQ